MDIKNPRRILCLGASNSGVLTLLKDLTGSAPTPLTIPQTPLPPPTSAASAASTPPTPQDPSPTLPLRLTTAGLTHILPLRTKYYNADVPIWLDEPSSPRAWKEDFLSEEAGEVVRAVGAWVVVFRRGGEVSGYNGNGEKKEKEDIEEEDVDAQLENGSGTGCLATLSAVKEVIDHAHGGPGIWDGVCLAIGMPSHVVGTKQRQQEHEGEDTTTPRLTERSLEDWEDLCLEYEFEYIAGDDKTEGRNAEGDLRGIARVREALEANDWSGEFEVDDDDEFDNNGFGAFDKHFEDRGFDAETRELEDEFANLNTQNEDVGDIDEAFQVEEFERMVQKLQATRDMSAHLPLHERRKVAAKAVNDLMKKQ